MLKQLLFSNPVFHDGINVTVRNGYKWADALGEIVDVMNTDGVSAPEMAHVLGVLTTQLDKIPESILEHEHDPSCRTLAGIAKEMRKVYGNQIQDNEPVTVLFFEFGECTTETITGEWDREQEKADKRVDIDIDFDEDDLLYLYNLAHEKDITLNQLINDMLTEFIEERKDGKSNN